MQGPFGSASGTAIRTQTESNSSAVQSDAEAPKKHLPSKSESGLSLIWLTGDHFLLRLPKSTAAYPSHCAASNSILERWGRQDLRR